MSSSSSSSSSQAAAASAAAEKPDVPSSVHAPPKVERNGIAPVDLPPRVRGGTLIIAPTSLVGQWLNELQHKCTNGLEVLAFYGSGRPRSPTKVSQYDVVLTTYAIMAYETSARNKKGSTLHDISWHRVVLDEGHTIKNTNTKQAKSVFKLASLRRWLLTGTPLCTNLSDLEGQLK